MIPEFKTRILEVVGDTEKADAVLDIIKEAEHKERILRTQRQLSGIEAAKKRGVQFGRPMMEMPKNFSKIYKKQRDGAISVTEASRSLHISRQQFYRLRKRFEDQLNTRNQDN